MFRIFLWVSGHPQGKSSLCQRCHGRSENIDQPGPMLAAMDGRAQQPTFPLLVVGSKISRNDSKNGGEDTLHLNRRCSIEVSMEGPVERYERWSVYLRQ